MSDGVSDVRGKAYSRSVLESEEAPIAGNLEMIRRTLDLYQWPIVDLHRQFTGFTMQPVVSELMRNLNIVNSIGAAAFPQLKILDGITPSILRSAELAQTF